MQTKIDIVNKKNQPTGQSMSIDDALKAGLWHRGAHVVIATKTGYILLQKRSSTMVMHPGLLDFSVGGFVDTNESPEQAAVRETKEESGLTITEADLHYLGLFYRNHAWPRLRKRSRSFIYAYTVVLPTHEVPLSIQQEEVEWARFVSIRQAAQLVRRHRIKSLGRLEPLYAFYRQLLSETEKVVRNA